MTPIRRTRCVHHRVHNEPCACLGSRVYCQRCSNSSGCRFIKVPSCCTRPRVHASPKFVCPVLIDGGGGRQHRWWREGGTYDAYSAGLWCRKGGLCLCECVGETKQLNGAGGAKTMCPEVVIEKLDAHTQMTSVVLMALTCTTR